MAAAFAFTCFCMNNRWILYLTSHMLTLTEAVNKAQNCPLWRLMMMMMCAGYD